MSNRIQEIAKESLDYAVTVAKNSNNKNISEVVMLGLALDKNSSLIVNEVLNILRQEWYDINNVEPVENENPRDVGFRVGRKTELVHLTEKFRKHFGVKE